MVKVIAKKWVLKKYFEGFPKIGDIVLEEEELPTLENGQFLAEAVYLSVDPYMRAKATNLALGDTMFGGQIALIKESKNPKYPPGKYVDGLFGWRTHTISNGKAGVLPVTILPDLGKLPLSLGLGVLGMPGNTAYFGFLELCKPKEGETVVVSGAAGAVGSHVGQIAKIKGCRVIGIAGSDEKGKWLTKELGFDVFINYKTQDIKEALKVAAPKGVDCYFDNVGGEMSSIVMNQMNAYGRIAVCGAISGYNDRDGAKASAVQFPVVFSQLKMEGFLVHRWNARWTEGIIQNLQWVKDGRVKYKETVYDGFEKMFFAFQDMLNGGNTGKAVVKV